MMADDKTIQLRAARKALERAKNNVFRVIQDFEDPNRFWEMDWLGDLNYLLNILELGLEDSKESE